MRAAIEAYVNTVRSDLASSLIATYESGSALASTYVAYSVGTSGAATFPNSLTKSLQPEHSYLRIDGPRCWIEFICQKGVYDASNIHFHSLWRDKTGDYAANF